MQSAVAVGLRYVTDNLPGITRVNARNGFRYRTPNGKCLHDREALQRIDSLAIPPAWTDVWICPDPNGHLQATGRDERHRKQHRYHPGVIDCYLEGTLLEAFEPHNGSAFAKAARHLRPEEAAVVGLLQHRPATEGTRLQSALTASLRQLRGKGKPAPGDAQGFEAASGGPNGKSNSDSFAV